MTTTSYPLNIVWLVDDDEVNNFICMKNIRDSKFADVVVPFLTVDLALKELISLSEGNGKDWPDVIFLDLNLPEENGWNFLTRYREFVAATGKTVRLFILSSSVYKKEINRATEYAEVSEYLIKPLTKEVLSDLMKRY